jgi:hypothetical protein
MRGGWEWRDGEWRDEEWRDEEWRDEERKEPIGKWETLVQ